WRLTALEPGPQRVAGQQALGPAPGLGATTGAVPASDANLLLPGSLARLQVMQLEPFSFFGHGANSPPPLRGVKSWPASRGGPLRRPAPPSGCCDPDPARGPSPASSAPRRSASASGSPPRSCPWLPSSTSVRLRAHRLGAVVGGQETRRDEILGATATKLGDLVGAALADQSVHGGLGHVEVRRRAQRLGEGVLDAGGLQDLADRSTGDDTGTGRGRLDDHLGGAVDAEDLVDDGAARHRDVDHLAPGDLERLLDRGRDLTGLAVADADAAVAVTHHDQRGEAEPAATLDDLGDAVDLDDALVVLVLLRARSLLACH